MHGQGSRSARGRNARTGDAPVRVLSPSCPRHVTRDSSDAARGSFNGSFNGSCAAGAWNEPAGKRASSSRIGASSRNSGATGIGWRELRGRFGERSASVRRMRPMPRRGHAWARGASETQRVRNRNPTETQRVLMSARCSLRGACEGLPGSLTGSLSGSLAGRLSAGRRLLPEHLAAVMLEHAKQATANSERASPMARFYKGVRISDCKDCGHLTQPDACGQPRCPDFGFRGGLLSDFRPFAVRNPADQLRFSKRESPCLKPGADASHRRSPPVPRSVRTGCNRCACRLAWCARSTRRPPALSTLAAACHYSATRAPSCRYRSR